MVLNTLLQPHGHTYRGNDFNMKKRCYGLSWRGLFIDVVPGLFPPLLPAGSEVFLGDAPEAPGPAVLLLHEAGVEIRLVVRAADGFERRRTDSATALLAM